MNTIKPKFLRDDIRREDAVALLRSARDSLAAATEENRSACEYVIEGIAYDIACIFKGESADVVAAAFGFSIVPGTDRHV